MKDGVPQPEAFPTGAEKPEVLRRLGDNMREKLDGDGAQRFATGRYFQEHLWISVSGVLLNSRHMWCRGTRAIGLAHSVLTLAEGLLEGFCDVCGFELGCQLLHCSVTIWEHRGKD